MIGGWLVIQILESRKSDFKHHDTIVIHGQRNRRAELHKHTNHPDHLLKHSQWEVPTWRFLRYEIIPQLAIVQWPDFEQFGVYILFPISMMYYYGTNLDGRFSTPDFWPTPEQTHKIPFEKDEIKGELERLKAKRLYLREKRLREEHNSSESQS